MDRVGLLVTYALFFQMQHIVASDLYKSHIDFCSSVLGVEGVLSKERISDLSFDLQFDLIFCGSLLTHLPESLCRDTIALFIRGLGETGLALVTFQGRFSDYVQKNQWKYLEDEYYAIAQQSVEESGFGYVDYDPNFLTKFNEQSRYGVTLIRPHWLIKEIERYPEVRILGYIERGWDNHQDVPIFGKPGINE